MSEKLDRLKNQKEKAEQKLRYYQYQEKMLEYQLPELTRKASTHRLCTRGGIFRKLWNGMAVRKKHWMQPKHQ